MSKYWENPYTDDVAKSSMVMLLFSVKQGTLPPGLEGAHGLPPVKVTVYLNILGIVVLVEPSKTFSEVPSGETAKDVSVDCI